MKKVLFSILALSLVILSSCGGADPTVFNDAILKANNDISQVKLEYDDEVTKSITDNNYAAIAAATDSALIKIDSELANVQSLKVPKGGEAFKEASIKTFESIRAIVEAGKKFASLTENSSQEDFDKIEKEYNEKEEAYSTTFDEMTKAQVEYAASIGYKVH
ncbi:MAG: hypothetical protein QM660_08660 [Dysgonomonas sp.]